MSALSKILENKIVAIVRGANPEDVVKIAEALYAGGIRVLEITMNSAEPLTVIKEIVDKFGTGWLLEQVPYLIPKLPETLF